MDDLLSLVERAQASAREAQELARRSLAAADAALEELAKRTQERDEALALIRARVLAAEEFAAGYVRVGAELAAARVKLSALTALERRIVEARDAWVAEAFQGEGDALTQLLAQQDRERGAWANTLVTVIEEREAAWKDRDTARAELAALRAKLDDARDGLAWAAVCLRTGIGSDLAAADAVDALLATKGGAR